MIAETIKDITRKTQETRNVLEKKECIRVGNHPGSKMGLYLSNYANGFLNRQIDIYDDSTLLLENNRIGSACAISRGMIETYAIGVLLAEKVQKILNSSKGKESAEKSVDLVIQFTNSSRFKQLEQEKLEKGLFSFDDFTFTEEAKTRMMNRLAKSQHVLNALRAVYKIELEQTKQKESGIELLYDGLSEWVHPSQTNIFHNYTQECNKITTSCGEVNFHEAAKFNCWNALYLLVDSHRIYKILIKLSEIITQRSFRQ